MKPIQNGALAALAIFLTFTFVEMTPDIRLWGDDARFGCGILMLLTGMGFVFVGHLNNEKNN